MVFVAPLLSRHRPTPGRARCDATGTPKRSPPSHRLVPQPARSVSSATLPRRSASPKTLGSRAPCGPAQRRVRLVPRTEPACCAGRPVPSHHQRARATGCHRQNPCVTGRTSRKAKTIKSTARRAPPPRSARLQTIPPPARTIGPHGPAKRGGEFAGSRAHCPRCILPRRTNPPASARFARTKRT